MHASDPEDACGRRRGEEAYATVAQRKERHPPEVGVAGSNPRGHVGTHDVPWKTEECWSIPAAVAHARRRKTRAPGRRAKAGAERRAAFLPKARIKGMESSGRRQAQA